MARIAPVVLLLALAAEPLCAAGTTPSGTWLPVIKDAIREKLDNPGYVTFRRIFFVNRKTDDGAVPVCGFANFKERKEEHAATKAFFGLLTPPDAGKQASFSSIQIGEEKDKEIATVCRNYGVY